MAKYRDEPQKMTPTSEKKVAADVLVLCPFDEKLQFQNKK